MILCNINKLTLTFSLDTLSRNWSKVIIKIFVDVWMQSNEIKVEELQILFT